MIIRPDEPTCQKTDRRRVNAATDMTNLFFRNPRLLALSVSLIMVAGLSSYYVLPRMEDPLLSERIALVNTLLPGADAYRVESLVTEKLEERLRELEEIKELRSESRSGVSTITIELRDDIYEPDPVWSQVRDKLADAEAELPPGASKPEFEDVPMKAYALIVGLVWQLDGPPNYAILRRQAEWLEDRLRAVPGTEDVDLFGDPDEEVVVEIEAARLAAMGLTAADIAEQLQASDAKVAAGQFRGAQHDLLLEIDEELDSLARIQRTPIQFGKQGHVAQLGDIAATSKGIADPPGSIARIAGRPAVALGVLVRAERRIDHWTEAIGNVLSDAKAELPGGVELSVLFEQNRYVSSRLEGLLGNLLIGGVAVVTVILLLMGWRSAVVVGLALPLAALMVLTGMRLLSIPVHQMSVTGLIIALGLLIDNAIVMVDDVAARLRSGTTTGEAVSQSVRHLATPLFGSTLTTALAFAPIALMPGPAGEFVGSIAVSVILAIGSSFLLAMTVIPALAALIRSRDASEAPSWWQVGFSSDRLVTAYRRSLGFILSRPTWGIALGALLPMLGFVLAIGLPEQFFPPADRDQLQIELELHPSASLAETLSTAEQLRSRILTRGDVEEVAWFLGESAPSFYYNVIPRKRNVAHYAHALVQLRSPDGSRELIHELQHELDAAFPQARVLVRQLEQGPPFDAPVEVRLYGPDMGRLRDLGDQIRTILAEVPDVIHTRAESGDAVPKLSLAVDEDEARLAGMDHARIAGQLQATLEGALGGTILEDTEELPVRVRVSNAERSTLEEIASLDLMPPDAAGAQRGSPVPLTALADMKMTPEASTIQRLNARRMNEVKAFITAGVLPAKALEGFRTRLGQSDFKLPPGYQMEYGGEAAERDEAVANLMANVGVLLVMMVATLVLSFRSFRMAGMIGAVGVLSVGLGLGALWLFGFPFGFMAIVGTMELVGVAINDAIVVLAAIREDDRAQVGEPVAVREVVVRATRHVVATSLTTMAGFAPLVLAGGGFWPPLAVAIAGGVSGATILALYFIPSAYILLMCSGKCAQHDGEPTSVERVDARPEERQVPVAVGA